METVPPRARAYLTSVPTPRFFTRPDSIDRVLETVDHLNRPDRSGERKVRIHAVGFPTIFSQARYGETTGVRFAMLMRALCERNGGAFVALNSLRP